MPSRIEKNSPLGAGADFADASVAIDGRRVSCGGFTCPNANGVASNAKKQPDHNAFRIFVSPRDVRMDPKSAVRDGLGSLQLGVLLNQLLQAEAWKLYRNLGFFAFSLALIDSSLAVFRMPDSLSGTESALASRLLNGRGLRHGELLAAAGEELGNVVDRVVGARRRRRLLRGISRGLPVW